MLKNYEFLFKSRKFWRMMQQLVDLLSMRILFVNIC